MVHRSGQVLFEDPLGGTPRSGWRVPPSRFVDHPDGGRAYLLEPGQGATVANPPWAGDESWEQYRVEFEVCTTGEKDGWVGPDFHVTESGDGCCNLEFYSTRERSEIVFEAAARWWRENLGWKLFPFAQRQVHMPKGVWAKVRVDVGDTFANVFVNDAPEPCYTVRHLPFSRGGIRFWNYYGSAYFRNLRVMALSPGEVKPLLADPWDAVAGQGAVQGVVRGWRMSRLLPVGTGKEGGPAAASPADMAWRDVGVDPRGIVIVSAAGREYATEKGVVFARAVVRSPGDGIRRAWLTYTDQLTMWVNGVEVFVGKPRGWFDAGRSAEEGFGRLVPNQFEVSLPLSAGENEMLVRLELNEPLFGSGFWVRLE